MACPAKGRTMPKSMLATGCPNWLRTHCPNHLAMLLQCCTPQFSVGCVPILAVLCPNSGGAVPQFSWGGVPIFAVVCPNGAPIFVVANPLEKLTSMASTRIGAQHHQNWDTAPRESGHSTARIGAQHNENWGTIGARIGAQSWSTHLGHSKARIGAHMLAHIRAHTRSHNLAMIRILLREHPG